MEKLITFCWLLIKTVLADDSFIGYNPLIGCNDTYIPDHCDYPNITLDKLVTVEDFDRCVPALLSNDVRNFFWSVAGRRRTYDGNFEGLRRLRILPRVLRDVSRNELFTTLLGRRVKMPIGISPTAGHMLADPMGEITTARAAASMGAVMILSVGAQTTLEDVAKAAFSVDREATLWMQSYIFKNRAEIVQVVRRAERAGYKAIVATIDSPVDAITSCNGRKALLSFKALNLFNYTISASKLDSSLTFRDLGWLVRISRLPVVAKGIMTGADAIKAAQVGVAGILISNHGGRQLDAQRPTIEVVPEVVAALRPRFPQVEVYMDGGIRNGWDIFKVLIQGAKAAFVGRPAIWGLAVGGQKGVQKVLSILRQEFNETMIISGYASPTDIFMETRGRQNIPSPTPEFSYRRENQNTQNEDETDSDDAHGDSEARLTG